MTRAGIVFSILNFFLTLVFLLVTAPVVNDRVEKRRQIEAIEKQIPNVQNRIKEAADSVAKLPYDITAELGRTTREATRGVNEKDAFEGRLAVLADAINDRQSKLRLLATAAQAVQEEIDGRKAEIAALNETLQQGQQLAGTRESEIAALKKELADAQAGLSRANQDIAEAHKKIIERSGDGAATTGDAARLVGAPGAKGLRP